MDEFNYTKAVVVYKAQHKTRDAVYSFYKRIKNIVNLSFKRRAKVLAVFTAVFTLFFYFGVITALNDVSNYYFLSNREVAQKALLTALSVSVLSSFTVFKKAVALIFTSLSAVILGVFAVTNIHLFPAYTTQKAIIFICLSLCSALILLFCSEVFTANFNHFFNPRLTSFKIACKYLSLTTILSTLIFQLFKLLFINLC